MKGAEITLIKEGLPREALAKMREEEVVEVALTIELLKEEFLTSRFSSTEILSEKETLMNRT